jgi:hypothetical protein
LLSLFGLLVACSSDGPRDTVLAAATIGPAGGQIEVTEGLYAGLRLTVPGGAMTQDVQVRFVKPAPPPGNTYSPAIATGPGPFVWIEPRDLVFLQPAALRLPYLPQSMVSQGPGNVRATQVTATGVHYLEPPVVDWQLGRIELEIDSLGGYQVVHGVRPGSIQDYLPANGTTVPLQGGYSFAYDSVLPPRFGARAITRWLVDTGSFAEGVYFEGWSAVGRVAPNADWEEIWATSVDAMLLEAYTTTPPTVTTTQVYSPISAVAPTWPGTATVLGRFALDAPVFVNGREFRDVLKIRLQIEWQRPDLGTGDTEIVYWFAPGVGLVQLGIDGVIRQRTDL